MIYVYGTEQCQYCDKAKALLEEKELDFKYYEITGDEELLKFMRDRGHASVPQVYFHSSKGDMIHWGGYTDLKARIS